MKFLYVVTVEKKSSSCPSPLWPALAKFKPKENTKFAFVSPRSNEKNSCLILKDNSKRYSEACDGGIFTNTDLFKEAPHSCEVVTECKKIDKFKRPQLSHFTSVCRDGDWNPPIPRCQGMMHIKVYIYLPIV